MKLPPLEHDFEIRIKYKLSSRPISDVPESLTGWASATVKMTARHPDIRDVEGVDCLYCSYKGEENRHLPPAAIKQMERRAKRSLIFKILHRIG